MNLSKSNIARVLAIAAALTGLATVVPAQTLQEGSVEALGYAGIITDGGDGTYGGGIAYAVKPRWLAVGELGYIAIGDNDFGSLVDSHAVEVNLNVHYLFPLRDHPDFTPYVLGGLAILPL